MAKDVGNDAKKARAAVLVSSGMPQSQIAQELKISERTLRRWIQEPGFQNVRADVANEIKNATVENLKQNLNDNAAPIISYDQKKFLIGQQCQQLDTAIEAIMPLVENGDLLGIDRLIKLLDRKSKLYGLDQKTVEIGAAIATLSQHGIIKENQASSAFQVMDEAEIKLFQIGLD